VLTIGKASFYDALFELYVFSISKQLPPKNQRS
jgi:hypothetical protein